MSNWNSRQPQSNNHHSWNTSHQPNFHWNSVDQQSPLPLLVPSFQQNTFDQSYPQHGESSNKYPINHHRKISFKIK